MPDLSITRRFLPDLTDEELLRTPAACCPGRRATWPTPIRGYRDTYGVSYIIVQAAARGGVREGDRRTALNRCRGRAPVIDRRTGTSPWLRYAGATIHSR